MNSYRRKLIEVALPLDAINRESAREKSIRRGHPSTFHLWWARRPLAACRAVLFGQLVDDPSAWPDLFPSEEEQDRERHRLFRIIEALVKWKSTNDESVLDAARLEIARSLARGRIADSPSDELDEEVLSAQVKPDSVRSYLAQVAPPVHDPFSGGGSIPLEAQRLGLRAIATDLNPVAVLINKAMIEIPPRFIGGKPFGPERKSSKQANLGVWPGASGLAEDIRRYGAWMREETFRRIGSLYPDLRVTSELAEGRPDLEPFLGKKLTVIAWLWVRMVESPDPAMKGAHVPLFASYWVCKKKGREAWLEVLVDRPSRTWECRVRTGIPPNRKAVDEGTKTGRGSFRCLLSDTAIPASYIHEKGQSGDLGSQLVAIVAAGPRRRLYLTATNEHEEIARKARAEWRPDFDFAKNSRHMTPWKYGFDSFSKLYTERQLVALSTFVDLLSEVRQRVFEDCVAAGLEAGESLSQGGQGGVAYSEAVHTFLALGVSRRADKWTALSIWNTVRETIESVIRLNALQMSWEFAEANPFSSSTGNFLGGIDFTASALANFPLGPPGEARLGDATTAFIEGAVATTDPPYYDNVPYADLSDLFYVWLRRGLGDLYPEIFKTILVPKANELVADQFRKGGRKESEKFFLEGMRAVLESLALRTTDDFPAAVFYAFKQTETTAEGTLSTGWETFLDAAISSGFSIVGSWPVRTEQSGGLRNRGRNSLASSIVLVCRKRSGDASTIARGDFRRLLRAELPHELRVLQMGNIAPVDLAQATIGPGMAIYSRHASVLEADGSAMTVRGALRLIGEVVDEIRGEEEGDIDQDTRFALTWYETYGHEEGRFGEADTLAKARNVSVPGVAQAGILKSSAGRVRLYTRSELPKEWDPRTDDRLTVWEATQHLIKRLEEEGETAAASLLTSLGPLAEQARNLAYRLYTACERKGWAEEAQAYNGLVLAWPELEKLAEKNAGASGSAPQAELFE